MELSTVNVVSVVAGAAQLTIELFLTLDDVSLGGSGTANHIQKLADACPEPLGFQ